MIVYDPLWETLKKKGLSTYTLRVKFGISGSTVQRLKRNMSVSTNTLDDLCKLIGCKISDIAEFIDEEQEKQAEEPGQLTVSSAYSISHPHGRKPHHSRERTVRIRKVESSILFISTTTSKSEPDANWHRVRIYCLYQIVDKELKKQSGKAIPPCHSVFYK